MSVRDSSLLTCMVGPSDGCPRVDGCFVDAWLEVPMQQEVKLLLGLLTLASLSLG